MIAVSGFPNLLFDKRALKNLEVLKDEDRVSVLSTLKDLDSYMGTSSEEVLSIEPLQPKSKYSPIMELKTKLDGLEHRFLYVKIPIKHKDREHGKYAILHSFLKKTPKVSDRDKGIALRVKKREDY